MGLISNQEEAQSYWASLGLLARPINDNRQQLKGDNQPSVRYVKAEGN